MKVRKFSPVHMGLVYDEYGALEGVVTTADILESIVGSSSSEKRPAEPRSSEGRRLISGLRMDAGRRIGDVLSISIPENRSYHTVAGLVLQHFAALPSAGDTFDYQGWRFEIVDLDGRRIDKILAAKVGEAA